MSESEPNASTDRPTDRRTDRRLPSDGSVREYLEYLALAVLVVFAVLSAFQFYAQASAAISTFVSDTYRPVFRALFNLVVLLVCAGGVAVLLDRRFDG